MTSEELFYNKKPGFDRTSWEKASEYAEGYKTFLDMGKTERDAVTAMIELAQEAGFAPKYRSSLHKELTRAFMAVAVAFAFLAVSTSVCMTSDFIASLSQYFESASNLPERATYTAKSLPRCTASVASSLMVILRNESILVNSSNI